GGGSFVLGAYVWAGGQNVCNAAASPHPVIIVLSAKNDERLVEQARQLRQAIDKQDFNDNDLLNIAYTLQVGREPMETRLALIVDSIADLQAKLDRYLQG